MSPAYPQSLETGEETGSRTEKIVRAPLWWAGAEELMRAPDGRRGPQLLVDGCQLVPVVPFVVLRH